MSDLQQKVDEVMNKAGFHLATRTLPRKGSKMDLIEINVALDIFAVARDEIAALFEAEKESAGAG